MGSYLRRCFGVECEFLLLAGGALESEYRAIAPTVVVADDAQLRARIKTFRERGFTRALVNTSAAAHATDRLRDAGIASVVLIHELPRLIKEKNLAPGVASALRHARTIVFATPFVHDQVLKSAGAETDDRCVILPQGCYKNITVSGDRAAAIRKELRIPDGEALVVGIGYADLRKGFDLFLQLWRAFRAQKKRVHVCWVGDMDPGLRDWLTNELSDARETGTFHLPGRRDDIDAFVSAANALALTSREDPFPTVALEALAAGIPVFAFDRTGGIPDMLRQYDVGSVLPYGDVNAMARAIATSLRHGISDTDRRRRRAVIREHFDFKAYVSALLKLAHPELIDVSVAVPNYNYAQYLASRLETIFHQSYPVSEILVLDDASNDDSLTVIGETATVADREVTIVANAANSGSVFSQWRKPATLAKSEYLWLAEADDLADSEFLARMLGLLAADREIRFAFCDSRTIDSDGAVIWPTYKPYYATVEPGALVESGVFEGSEFVARFLSVKNLMLNVSAVVWRRDALLAALDACESELKSFKMAGDWRLYLEALSTAGARIAYEATPLNVHRRHAQSVTHSLDADRHVDEIARCHAFARQAFALNGARERQAKYLAEIRAQFRQPAGKGAINRARRSKGQRTPVASAAD
jgi:glycosyltransferase involved in cell wall biosynthesis